MKHNVIYSCGHSGEVELFGPSKERERKLKWYQTSGLCPKCYAEYKNKERASQAFQITATVIPDIDQKTGDLLINVWFSGNTLPHKDDIKALGRYQWDYINTAKSSFSAKLPEKGWQCIVKLSDLPAVLEEAYQIGAEKFDAEKGIFASVHYEIARQKRQEWERKQEQIQALPKPEKPARIVGKRWNSKVYGRQGSYCIYLDSEKTEISDEEAKQLQQYVEQINEYEKQVKALG